MKFRVEDAIHLVVGAAAAGTLRSAGAQTVLYCDDWLSWGPCSADASKHRAFRISLWGDVDPGCDFSTRVLGSALNKELLACRRSRPIVIWTANTWTGRLSALWLCSALARVRAARAASIYLSDACTPEQFGSKSARTSVELGANGKCQLLATLAKAREVNLAFIESGLRLWQAYASDDPTEFDSARRNRFPDLPLLNFVAGAYGILFPRLAGGRLQLSVMDGVLMEYFATHDSQRWHPVGQVINWILTRHRYLVCALGSERFAWLRLRVWADETAVLEREAPTADGGQPERYRATEAGLGLIRAKAVDFSRAPSLWVGGCQLGLRHARWARRQVGRGWSIVRVL